MMPQHFLRTPEQQKTSLSWRAAHAWLRGYSDARAGLESSVPEQWAEYTDSYERGHAVGSGVVGAPALSTSGKAQCQG